jgi:hypothetical protein
MSKRTRVVNDIGIGFAGFVNELVKDIRVYPEGGSVQVWVEVAERGSSGKTHEAMQYLSPEEAMAFSKALRRCAIQALEERA